MSTFSLILLLFLVFVALVYTIVGLRFSLVARKGKRLAIFFLLGLVIGIIGGFMLIYNLKFEKGAAHFHIQFERWWFATVISIIVGGIISLIVYLKFIRK